MSKYRQSVDKRNGARRFSKSISRTKAPNMMGAVMRGGIRL